MTGEPDRAKEAGAPRAMRRRTELEPLLTLLMSRSVRAPPLAGEPERAGRWWWDDDRRKECGLHIAAGSARRASLGGSTNGWPAGAAAAFAGARMSGECRAQHGTFAAILASF
jgi:hypothetical protein